MEEHMTTTGQCGVGVIGLGHIGQLHMRGVRASSAGFLAAVADVSDDLVLAAREQSRAAGYNTAAELLADPRVDAVTIGLPHYLHHPVAAQAIEAGKDVLVEKPLALTVAECDDLLERAKKAGVRIGVDHNQVFDRTHRRARALIELGEIGAPSFIRMRLGLSFTHPGWRANTAHVGGGLLYDAGIHRFYLARYLFGEMEVAAACLDVPSTDGEQFAVVVLRFENGATGVIEANYSGAPKSFDDSIEITGTAGLIYLRGIEAPTFGRPLPGPALRFHDGERWNDEDFEGSEDGDYVTSVIDSVAAFCDAIARPDAEPPVTAWDGRETVRLVHDAYQCAQIIGRSQLSPSTNSPTVVGAV
jgi:predicted dehydrogenase